MGRWNTAWSALGTALGYRIHRGLGVPPQDLADVVHRELILAPGVDEPAIRPIISESHLKRIQGGFEGRPADLVRKDITARRHLAAPTRALLLKDVVLLDRAFYAGMHKEDLFRGSGLRRSLFSEPAADLDQGVWATSYAGARWFGHFLHDDLPMELLASGLGRMLGHARTPYPHEEQWRRAFGMPGPEKYGMLRVRELLVPDDRGQNPGKRKRYASLRERVAGNCGQGDRIVLRRPAAGGEIRAVHEEELLWDRLRNEGFKVVDVGTLRVDELVQQCAGASMVVSVDGSHAAPAFYLTRPSGKFVLLFPPYRVSGLMPQLAGFFGLQSAIFVGQAVEGMPGVFKIDADELMRFLDQVSKDTTWDPVPQPVL